MPNEGNQMDATVRLEHSVLAVEEEHELHAMVELAVPALREEATRPPLRVALVVDRSGSMHGAKLSAAKRCAQWIAERLQAKDELGLVAFDDRVRLLTPLASVDGPRMRAAIASIGPGGSTNLSGGWLRGLGELVDAPADGPRKIMLLTDGLANAGITNRDDLVQMARRARLEGVTTSTIGFGAGYDEELLRDMADAGGGSTYFAATPDDAPGIFERELEGLTRVVAHNVTLEVRPGGPVELLGVLNDYPSVAVEDGAQVELGDAYAGERRRVVVRFRIPHLAALGPCVVAELVLRYTAVGETIEQRTTTIPIVANVVSAAEAANDVPDADVREEVLVLRAARVRDEAIRLADEGEIDFALAAVESTARDLEAAGLVDDAADLRTARTALHSYDAMSRKLLNQQSWDRKRGRGRPRPGRE
jgi:Ca-activated chloride channel family protein